MPEAVATVTDVRVKQTRNGDLYTVSAGDRDFLTKKRSLAEQAKELRGQAAILAYNVREGRPKDDGGRWPDSNWLEDISAAPGQTKPATTSSNGGRGMSPEERTQMHRTSALYFASRMLANSPEGEKTPENVLRLARFGLAYIQGGEESVNAQQSIVDEADDIPF